MADRPAPLLRVNGLVFRWSHGQAALDHCDIEIPRPGLWMLVGSNGSGKSTLLRLISGLLQADGGTIQTPLKPALVFQNPDHQLLLPSCGSDLQLGLPAGLPVAERTERMERALRQVGLTGMERRPIHTLSGGQKQRSQSRDISRKSFSQVDDFHSDLEALVLGQCTAKEAAHSVTEVEEGLQRVLMLVRHLGMELQRHTPAEWNEFMSAAIAGCTAS
jgi:ABC-type nitrate/sulfonate/bicarbonate transport system ATPase subunit